MAQASFPEQRDLDVPYDNMVGDGTSKVVSKYTVANPHPGFGVDPNILNEYGHTKYPMYVGDKIVNNEKEEQEARNPSTSWGRPV